MRCIFITLWLCLCKSMAMAQPPNNAIFTGGIGDGYSMAGFSQSVTNIYSGGSGDGWSIITYQQPTNYIFGGGDGDGWSMASFLQSANAIYSGGVGDGWSMTSFLQSANAIYGGGVGDGWSSVILSQADNNLFQGGIGDGWSSTYRPMGPLPVTMEYFKATKQDRQTALLTWKTLQEDNAAHFEVERSEDAVNFKYVDRVLASGNKTGATYQYKDNRDFRGVVYYRIKSVDRDGKYSYTPSRVLNFGGEDQLVARFYPNPTRDILNVEIPEGFKGQTVVINISNALGAVVDQQKIFVIDKGTLQLHLGKYPRGIYLVQLKSKEAGTTQRIVLR